MAEQLTKAQSMVVNDRGGKLLVSAAAGSGKTKVLVDRLLKYLSDPVDPANMDDFLIITFTKAAAAELRGKIAEKLSERIAEDPSNVHLQNQIQRLYLAKISTVHSFCSDTLREYAYKLNISPDFRVIEPTDCESIKGLVMERILNQAYEELPENPDLQAFLDSQGLSRNDDDIPGIINKLYENSCCHADPQGWLDWCLNACSVEEVSDPAQTVWGEYLIRDFHEKLSCHLKAMEKCVSIADNTPTFEKVSSVLRDEINIIHSFLSCSTWQQIVSHPALVWNRLDFPRKTSYVSQMEVIKAVRNYCKSSVQGMIEIFANNAADELNDLKTSCAAVRGLLILVSRFAKGYSDIKKARRNLDYNDLEHGMLDLLLGRSRSGPTLAARELGQRFREIMVDEYQDTNEVQDMIFSVLSSERNNCFMVGDVKQSIYQFRLADPDIFIQKYNAYVSADKAEDGQPRKIVLSANFRSATQVIHAVNDVCGLCMSPKVGGLNYGADEKLYEGIEHETVEEPEVELHCLTTDGDTYEQEAELIAQRIRELLDGNHMIRDKKLGLRPIIADDIVILLRSPKSNGGCIIEALEKCGIRAAMEKSSDILQTEEVQTLVSLLEAINNPLHDIPLAAAMASRVFGFTADDLAQIRAGHKDLELYHALEASSMPKARAFMEVFKDLRAQARMLPVSELIACIFARTGFDTIYSALSDGPQRSANLQAFCTHVNGYVSLGTRDLGQFVEHIRALTDKGLIMESDTKPSGCVMIYSIHKSKGLEFPVVVLGCLSRDFSAEDAKKPVLCHKDLGVGLNWVDSVNRVRYPTLCKKAILKRIQADQVSEEMRVLYVAMTRAKDRLIMTYANKYLVNELKDLVPLMQIYDSEYLAAQAMNPGAWILYTAMHRTEAGELFAIAGNPECGSVSEYPWMIRYRDAGDLDSGVTDTAELHEPNKSLSEGVLDRMYRSLNYRYAHDKATGLPSKLTATQIKGRVVDSEIAENAPSAKHIYRNYRKPSFIAQDEASTYYGNAIHKVMQYIDYSACTSLAGIQSQLQKLTDDGYLTTDQAKSVNCQHILKLFETELGKILMRSENVLREFKFSVLEDARSYYDVSSGEKILMQGIVDCAILDDDGITVLDFKSDHVTAETLYAVAAKYKEQIRAYASALCRIYDMPIKRVSLYFFRMNTFVDVD